MLLKSFAAIVALIACNELSPADIVGLGDNETIVLYGDSITEQNFYSAYLETFLISRFPGKALTIYNYGWSGDVAARGSSRFARDAVPVNPTLVFVDYGMNDGGYRPPDERIRNDYLAGQRSLAAQIRAIGAREVLLTTSPIDYDHRPDGDVYNETLSQLASSLSALGAELGLPVIDQFTPLRALQRDVKSSHPGFTMIPDSVHPDQVGHLAMAYHILNGIEFPRSIGSVKIDGEHGDGIGGVTVQDLQREDGRLDFTLGLPFIPFFVPEAARPGLALVPFVKEFNAFTLTVCGLDKHGIYTVMVDDRAIADFSGGQLGDGVDISGLDAAAWSRQGRLLWDAAQTRRERHYDLWRHLAFQADGLKKLPSFRLLRDAEAAFVRESSEYLRLLAQPKPYRVTIARLPTHQNWVVVQHLELSPLYPFSGVFDQHFPPETEEVTWQRVALPANGLLDLLTVFPAATNCAVYARFSVQADAACTLHFSLGSDDGLEIFVDGRRVHARDINRSLVLGDDVVDADISSGSHLVLMRITQGLGGFGLGMTLNVVGGAAKVIAE